MFAETGDGGFLKRARQDGRLRVHNWALVAGAVLVIAQAEVFSALPRSIDWVGGLITPLVLAVVALSAASMRCPSCGTRFYLRGLGEHGTFAELGRWLASLEECPACGSDGLSRGAVTEVEPVAVSKVAATGAGLLVAMFVASFTYAVGVFGLTGATTPPWLPNAVKPVHLAIHVLSWAIASFVGAALAARIARSQVLGLALAIGFPLLLLSGSMSMDGPWPAWFRMANAVASMLPALAGVRVGGYRRG